MGERLKYLLEQKEAIKEIAARHKAHSVAVFGLVSRGGLKPRDTQIRAEALAL